MDLSRTKEIKILLSHVGLTGPFGDDFLEIVNQALTHISTGQSQNNEKLEFLGDAVLRLAATEFIERHYPQLTVGEFSNLRAQLVSDRWLADIGNRLQIDNYLKLGKHAVGDTAAKSSINADATEALIGALYSALGDLEVIHSWLTPHWQATAKALLATPHQFGGKTALQEWSQGQGLGLPSYATEECSRQHGDPERFRCRVSIQDRELAEAKGRSRKEAEQNAATAAIQALEGSDAPQASQ